MDEPNLIEVEVTCTCPGCPNEGAVLVVLVNADCPAVMCGPCGEWIIAPPAEPE
ncbi:hypothetical protein [Microbacterium sp. YY-01]|uniref:hypothetical protein n=1 Tax=Microbacterium sp. YY-01 TaxID=3421634 RepID=UPI003D182F90